jgi:hypothetical protein
MPLLKMEKPGLKQSQYRDMLWKMWWVARGGGLGGGAAGGGGGGGSPYHDML